MKTAVGLLLMVTGAIVWGFILFVIAAEIRRSMRQASRLYQVCTRKKIYKKSVRTWFRIWRNELTSSYTSLTIGDIRIPRDPNKKISRNPIYRG